MIQNTIILTIHNKEDTIALILENLFNTVSSYTVKLILILDGCTDQTYKIINKYLKYKNTKIKTKIIFTDDIWETKANNVGLKEVQTEYATIVQDDMLIKHKNWDKILIDKLLNEKIFSISGRAAYDFKFNSNNLEILNIVGREYPFSNKNLFGKIVGKIFSFFKPYWIYKYISFFSVRKINNRGPLVLKNNLARQLGFFDEAFAPFELDDFDLCCRAYKKFGLYSGCYPIFYKEINGSKKNNSFSQNMSQKSIIKNTKIVINRHYDLSN